MDIDGVKVYVGGKQDFIDNCDPDRMFFEDIDEIMKSLQYRDMQSFGTEYLVLVKILSDKEVLSMCEAIPELKRVVQLYLVQPREIKLLDGAHETEANHTANLDVASEKKNGTEVGCEAANESSCEKDGNPIKTEAIHTDILEKEAVGVKISIIRILRSLIPYEVMGAAQN